jgi:hypothetical protein
MSPNEYTYHNGSGEQVQNIHSLSSHAIDERPYQGQASPSHQKNKHLARKRAIHSKIPQDKEEAGSPQKGLNNRAEFGIISPSKEEVPNGRVQEG